MREHQHRHRAFGRAHHEVRHHPAVEDAAGREADRARAGPEAHSRGAEHGFDGCGRERRAGSRGARLVLHVGDDLARDRRARRRDQHDERGRDARDEARRDREEPRALRARRQRRGVTARREAHVERAPDHRVHRAQLVLVARASRAFAAVRLDPGAAGERLGADVAPEFQAGRHDSGSAARPSCWRRRARARNSRVSTAPCCMPIMSAISCVE